jgi:hypothetical protein
MTIKFTHTARMLLAGHWAMHARRIVIVGMACLVYSALAVAATLKKIELSSLMLMGTVILWVVFVSFYLLRPWLSYRSWMKEPGMASEWVITLDDEGLRGSTSIAESRRDWSAFSKLIERRDLFILPVGKMQLLVIPKSAFASQDDLARFREIVTSKIAPVG